MATKDFLSKNKLLIKHLSEKKDLISFFHYDEKIDDLSKLRDENYLVEHFNDKYIFMGLNPSRNLKGDYSNFHDTNGKSKDRRLKEILETFPQFECCLIMDLYNEINPDSTQITNKEEDVYRTLHFIKPLLDGGAKIIAIGGKVFNELKKEQYSLVVGKNLFPMPHYSQGPKLAKDWQNEIKSCLLNAIQE